MKKILAIPFLLSLFAFAISSSYDPKHLDFFNNQLKNPSEFGFNRLRSGLSQYFRLDLTAATFQPGTLDTINLAGQDLRGMLIDFTNTLFQIPVNFTETRFDPETNFNGAFFFEGAQFTRAEMPGANFIRAFFNLEINFTHANLNNANFTRALFFNNTQFENANAEGANFARTNFAGIRGENTQYTVNFENAHLNRATFRYAIFRLNLQANFNNANLTNTDFGATLFEGLEENRRHTFHNADLTGATFFFEGADPETGDLARATTIQDADFTNATLVGADFRNARLINVDFTNADLRDANFEGATFINVNFEGARNLETVLHTDQPEIANELAIREVELGRGEIEGVPITVIGTLLRTLGINLTPGEINSNLTTIRNILLATFGLGLARVGAGKASRSSK